MFYAKQNTGSGETHIAVGGHAALRQLVSRIAGEADWNQVR